jgi:uncharacterized protein (DUF342 family)
LEGEVSDRIAQATIAKCVCSVCWGRLVMKDTTAVCINGCEGGYVSKAFVERRKAESAAEKVEVSEMLRAIGVLPERPKKSEEQILKELGY